MITSRRRKDGANSYTEQVKIMRDGAQVYQESQTVNRKWAAQVCIPRWETELAES